MTVTAEQLEKQTIVTRLSVSIYKMADKQLRALLHLLENEEVNGMAAAMDDMVSQGNTGAMQRQMVIARLFVLINQMPMDTLLKRLIQFDSVEFQWVREFPRLQCYLEVDFASHGRAYSSCIRDISASGVFIETNDTFEVGQAIALCFTLTESNETLPFKIKGHVIRVSTDGIGVQYDTLSTYQRDIIQSLIPKMG